MCCQYCKNYQSHIILVYVRTKIRFISDFYKFMSLYRCSFMQDYNLLLLASLHFLKFSLFDSLVPDKCVQSLPKACMPSLFISQSPREVRVWARGTQSTGYADPCPKVMAVISTVDQRQMDTWNRNRFIKHIIISVLNWFNLRVLSFLIFVSTALGKQ